nr:hypothetical protein [Tanacetum cinerariifolium]
MAPLTFADTHNMVVYLSKSDASEGFDQIVDFLNAHTIQYALVVNPTIYVSYDVDGVECLPNEEIFEALECMGYEKPPPKLTFYKAFFFAQWKFLIHTLVQCLSAKRIAWNEFSSSMASAVICLATVVLDNQVDDISTHNTRYISPALTQKVFVNMKRVGKGFLGVETPLFASMLVQPQPQAEEEEKEVKIPITPAPQSLTSAPSPPPQDPTSTPHATPPQEDTSKQEEKIKSIDVDEDITFVDVEKDEEVVTMDAETQERINQEEVNAASKGVSAAEPTIFDDKEVTMTMARTLIRLKAKKAKLLDEQIAQKLHDEEVQKAAARDK